MIFPPPFHMVFLRGLHPKLTASQAESRSPPQICVAISSWDHCLQEGNHGEQGSGHLQDPQYQTKEEAAIQRGQSKKVVALLVCTEK